MKLFQFCYLKRIFYILSIFFLIKCQNRCSECTISDINNKNKCSCSSSTEYDVNNCLPDLYSGTCHYCPYTKINKIYPYIIEDSTCSIAGPTTHCNRITYENNQCVDDCGEGYQLGEYCFKSCYEELGLQILSSSECKCQKYYIEIPINNNIFFNCVESCPYYYDEETKKCVDKCEGEISRIKDKSCKKKCDDTEVLYIVGEKNYCLEKCPEEANFYYEKKFSEETVCKEKCNDYDFYSKTDYGYKCSSECENQALIDLSNNIIECTDDLIDSDCSNDKFPYKYLGSCFASCSDTEKLSFFGSKPTYIYNDHDKTICSEDCKEYYENGGIQTLDVKHIDGNKLSCVECKTTSYKFYYGENCLQTCETPDNKHPYHDSDTGECVKNCGTKLLLKDTCYEECPSDSENKFNYNNIQCNTCKNPTNPDDIKNGEGYYIKEFKLYDSNVNSNPNIEDINWKDNHNNIKCLSSCPVINYQTTDSKTYYAHKKNDDNECMFGEACDSIEGNDYLYSTQRVGNTLTICYKSCKDIPGNIYIFEEGHLCKELCDNEHYYYESSGTYKCIQAGEDEEEICISRGLYYLNGNECVKDCSTGQYKIEYDSNNQKLGECLNFENPYDKSKCDYYSITEKICYSECPYRIVKVELTDEQPQESSDGNCVINCPIDYPYEYDDNENKKKYCLKNYDGFYYPNDNGIKKCISNCKDISKYYLGEGKECLDECPKQIDQLSYYFYDQDNKCVESCKNLEGLSFALEAKEKPQECIQTCPTESKYYYEEDKICLKECFNGLKGFIKNKDENECTLECGEAQYIINGDTCSDECLENENFIVEKIVTGKTFKYCESKCDEKFNFYYYDKQKKIYNCMLNCESKKEYGNICLDECPEGLYEESNKCIPKCDNKPYYKKKEKYYECTNTCNDVDGEGKTVIKYISSTNECVDDCLLGENFIGNGNICKSVCDPLIDGNYFIFFKSMETPSYNIYTCKQECDINSNEKYVEGRNECVTECPDDKPYLNGNTCYSLCLNAPSNQFSFTEEEVVVDEVSTTKIKYSCKDECTSEKENYQIDKVCVNGCFGINDIINMKDMSCVNKCDHNSYYKFLKIETVQEEEEEEIEIKKCVESCQKYTVNDYICYEGKNCPKPYNFINGNECLEKCENNLFANPNDENDPPNEYNCQINCDSGLFYYEEERICLNNCNNGFNIENTNKCVKSCTDIKIDNMIYYSYEPVQEENEEEVIGIKTCVTECPNDKPYKDIDNSCSDKCKSSGYTYYKPQDKICTNKCEGDFNKIYEVDDGFQCLSECPENTYLNETGICVATCKGNSTGGFNYFSKTEKKCLQKCNNSEFMNDFECTTSCPEEKHFIEDGKCVDCCSNNKRYYIDTFEHGEIDLNDYCYMDCPKDYPFEKVEKVEGDQQIKETGKCIGSCTGYYISNKDSRIIAKQCVLNCLDKNYNYFVEHNNTHKECFNICPNGKKYYIPLESGTTQTDPIKCYSKCPSSHPYHKRNTYECIKECDDTETNYATYDEKQCLTKCDIDNFWIKDKTPTNKDIILCVSDCSHVDNARFYTPERECVSNCDENKYLIGNTAKGVCECKKLFYFNENGVMQCFDNTIFECGKENTATKDYPIQINNSNQCIKNCFGVLSPSEKVCYINGEECPKNSKKGIFNGKIKCECEYKFYFDKDNDKKCLDENEQCPDEYKYFVPDENKCVSSCALLDNNEYKIVFDNKCLKSCPVGMSETDDKSCKCSKYWYKTPEDKYICLKTDEDCNNNYPYLIGDTGECAQNCYKTEYDTFYGNKCISSCESNMIKVDVESGNPLYKIASKTCRCQNAWTEEGYCSPNSGDTCQSDYFKNLDLDYQVKATKQCVQKCPDYYPFYFNKECFESCDNAKSEFGYNVKKESDNSNKCVCDSNWRINENGSMECIEKCEENEIEIEDNKQCVIKPDSTDNLDNFKCPQTSPYFFNNKCYSQCPDDTRIDNTKGNSCICDSNYYWFKQDSGLITCLSNKCPYNTFPYYINITKECVKSKEQCEQKKYKKIFNYACYNQCPYLTVDNENKCECDQKNYFWYKYKDTEDFREYLVCNLEECPPEKPYYINGTNECISRCGDLALYEYSKVCYNECPLFTQKNKKDYICEFSTESNNLQELVGNVTNRIVDIYPDLPNGGLVINNEEASLQIYGLNRDNYNNTDAIVRTNLAYIDLSGCIDKIYESNNMESKDDIVVVKLDLKSRNKKLIINPVEYEFINSKNGKILDASVCEKNQVVISYPITYMLNSQKKRNLQDEEEPELENEEEKEEDAQKKDISDKFNKGKKLNDLDKSIDTFNFNSSIYYDICTPLEIEGKDLVLENRIQSLFPNYSFCESICTYDYTDFKGERIYCNCSIKSGIDVDRPHGVKIYQFTKNELDNNQKGPTNLPILKCVSKAKIGGNAAFYYCIVFIIIEIILLLLVIFYGISSLVNKIRKKAIDSNGNKEEDKKRIEYSNSENDKISGNKMDKDIKYNINSNSNTKRKMNANEIKINANPPKNGIVDTDEEEDEKREGEININIKKNKEKKENKNTVDEKPKFDIFSEPHEMEIENEYKNEIEKYLQNNEIESRKGFFQSMKEEEKLLTAKYSHSLVNDKFDWVTVVLTSIFDKIYVIKILLLSGKYDIIPLMFSLYLLCHMLLLTFVTFFYDVKTIKNIWIKENYPDTNYYLSYGFLANIIVWLIFKMFCCLLDNEHKIKKLNITINDKKEEKYNRVVYKIKRNMIIYLVLQFLIILFCSFYLITFCGIYVGTKKNVFESYGIAFIEIIIIKIIYGFILGILRKVSLLKEINILYKIILIFNKYIS